MNAASFRLAPDVYACASEEGAVLLDLNRDAYLGLSAEQSHALSHLVSDWPRAANTTLHVDPAEAEAFARSLAERGLLVTHTAASLSTHHPAIPTDELMPWGQMRWRHMRLHNVLVFLGSLLTALWILHGHGLPYAVRRARARKPPQTANLSVETLRQLISSYFHTRLLFFAPRGQCLLDSIVLVEFLRHYGVDAEWVIGVRIKPFSAHSWVQLGSGVMNGTAGYVRAYQPILTV
jgi:hypothetical protein